MVCTAWGPDLDAGLVPKETGVCTFASDALPIIFHRVACLKKRYA
jgi:hypothetical protein